MSSAARVTPAYPAAPWSLCGDAIIATRTPRIAAVRELVPAHLALQAILPGRTLALLALVNYTAGSTLVYRELIVVPAIVRAAGRIGAWISHIYVDDVCSLAAGREIWGLPKQFASFDWRQGESRVQVKSAQVEVDFRRASNRSGVSVHLPLLAPAFGLDHTGMKWLLARGTGRIAKIPGRLSCRVTGVDMIDFDSCSSFFHVRRFALQFPAPRITPPLTS